MRTNLIQYGIVQIRDLLHPLIKEKKITFSGVADWYVFSLFVLPSYFGIRLVFFDLTAVRLFEVLLLIGIYKNKKRRADFISLVKRCPNLIFIVLYTFVLVYTDLYRRSISSILYWLMNCVVVLFCIAYLIVYEYGLEEFVNKVKKCAWIITAISPLELVIGKPPFSFLDTLNKSSTNSRFGNTRIMGNCTTTNGYAMYLMILLPLFCYDWEKKRIDIGKNKFLIALMALNIFLTGSRLTIGTLLLGLFLCFIAQSRKTIVRELKVLMICVPMIALALWMIRGTSIGNSLYGTFFSAVDEVLGTSYATAYGVNETTLYNSSYYRELLWKNTFGGTWLNPWFGKGGDYEIHLFIEGYDIQSCDNYYVAQYVEYAYPGLITWIVMSVSFLISMVQLLRKRMNFGYAMMVSFVCYFISLWYLDHLQTFPIMMAIFGMTYAANSTARHNMRGDIDQESQGELLMERI